MAIRRISSHRRRHGRKSVTLLLPAPTEASGRAAGVLDSVHSATGTVAIDEKKEYLLGGEPVSKTERFVFNELITGGFRMGVTQQLMVKRAGALCRHRRTVYWRIKLYGAHGRPSILRRPINCLKQTTSAMDNRSLILSTGVCAEEDITTLVIRKTGSPNISGTAFAARLSYATATLTVVAWRRVA